MVGLGVMEGGAHVVPVVAQRGLDLLIGGDHQGGGGRVKQVEQGDETLDREQLGDVGALGAVLQRGDLGARERSERAMLGGELGGGRHLDALGFSQRALGEGREPAQGLDLVAEQVDAHGPLLGGRIEVDQAPAHGELAPVLDLVDALVARLDERRRARLEVELLSHREPERAGAKRGVGDLLGQGHGGDHHHRRLGLPARLRPRLRRLARGLAPGLAHEGQQRVERRHPQPHQVGGGSEVGLIGDPARGIEAHGPRGEPGPQVDGQVAGGAVIGGHHQGGAVLGQGARDPVEQGGDQVGAKGGGDERPAAVPGQGYGGGLVGGVPQQGAQGARGGGGCPLRAHGAP